MDWIVTLLTDSNSVAHIVLIYAFAIALGVRLGKMKLFGVSLGVTFVLFVGILLGHFGLSVNPAVLHFVREFGLILFIFSIGLQVGPGFFSSFKKGGLLLNGLAVLIIALNIVATLIIYYSDGTIRITDLVGILYGAVTNTPGLAAAQQTLIDVQHNSEAATTAVQGMSMGYAAAYPLGVLGIILSMILVKLFFKVKVEQESKAIENENEESQLKPHVVTFKVENKLIAGQSVKEIHNVINRNYVISRVKKPNGDIIIPNSKTTIDYGDHLLIVMSAQDEPVFESTIGHIEEMEWEQNSGPVVSRRILVTNSQFNGRKIIGTVGQLQFEVIQYRLENEYNARCRWEPLHLYKACWIESDDEKELENFKKRKYQYMAKDREGRDVFLADSGYVLQMAQEDFKNIKFHFTSEF